MAWRRTQWNNDESVFQRIYTSHSLLIKETLFHSGDFTEGIVHSEFSKVGEIISVPFMSYCVNGF